MRCVSIDTNLGGTARAFAPVLKKFRIGVFLFVRLLYPLMKTNSFKKREVKKMKKKLITGIMAAMMVLGLTACSDTSGSTVSNPANSDSKTYKVGDIRPFRERCK